MKSLSRFGVYGTGAMNLKAGAQSVRVSVAGVSNGFFETLGLLPALGRLLDVHTDDLANECVVSTDLFQSLGMTPTDLNSTLILNGRPFVVVGVVNRALAFPGGVQIWIP